MNLYDEKAQLVRLNNNNDSIASSEMYSVQEEEQCNSTTGKW